MKIGHILTLTSLDKASKPRTPKELFRELSGHSLTPAPMAESTFFENVRELLDEGLIRKAGSGKTRKYEITKKGRKFLDEQALEMLSTLECERSRHINAAYICDLSIARLKEGHQENWLNNLLLDAHNNAAKMLRNRLEKDHE